MIKIKGPIILRGGQSFAAQLSKKMQEQNPEIGIKLPFTAEGFQYSNKDIAFDEKTGIAILRPDGIKPAQELTGPMQVVDNPKPAEQPAKKAEPTVEIQVKKVPEIDKFKALPVKEEIAKLLFEKYKTMNDMLRLLKRPEFQKDLAALPKVGKVTVAKIIVALEAM